MSFKYPANATSCPPISDYEPLLTVAQFKERYLFGIDLTDKDGKPIPDAVFQQQIMSAAQYLETKININIFKREFVENYDYRSVDYAEFNFIQLKQRPLNEFKLLRAKFPNNIELVRYPEEWYVTEKESAQLQLSPVQGTFSGLIVQQGGSTLPLIYGTQSYWPHLFEATYTAGFDHDKIPVLINDMIGMRAAIRAFDILGDILFGPISNESVGLDGANTSQSRALAPGVSAFAARIKSYKEDLKEYINTVRDHYRGIPLAIG